MAIHNQDHLAAHFRSLDDEELIKQCAPGRLTDVAEATAKAEVLARGLQLPEVPESTETDEENIRYYGDYKSVARFLDPIEAHLIKAHLESCAIPAIVADANLVQTNPFLGGAIGGTSVRVPEAFVPEAHKLIAKFKEGAFQAAEDSSGAASNDLGCAEPANKEHSLRTYRVYSCPGKPVPVVVKVGFSWAAFIFGPLWFLANFMWINFLIVAALVVGGNFYFRTHSPSTETEWLLFAGMYAFYLVAWFLIGRFANAILAAELEDRGCRLLATVKAKNPTYARDEAFKVAAHQPDNV